MNPQRNRLEWKCAKWIEGIPLPVRGAKARGQFPGFRFEQINPEAGRSGAGEMTMQPFRIFVSLDKMLHYSDVQDVPSSRQFTEIGDAVRNQVGLSCSHDFRPAQL